MEGIDGCLGAWVNDEPFYLVRIILGCDIISLLGTITNTL